MGPRLDSACEERRSEQRKQMLAFTPEQAPLSDQDPNSSSHKLDSISEVLQDFFLLVILQVT